MSQTPGPSPPSRPPVSFAPAAHPAEGVRPTNAGASGGIPSTRFARTLPPPPPKGFFPTVEASERRLALSAFFSLFGILTAHTMLETARDTLFLSRLPLGRLPYVYLAIAALSALLVRVAGGGGTPRGTKQPVTLPLALIFAAVVDGGFWVLSTNRSPAIYYALYIWSGIFGSWAVLTFWYLLARVVDVQRAKRLYPVIGAGALAGGIFGSAAARVIVWLVPSGASMVILGSGIILVLNALGPTLVFARDIGKSGFTVERSRRGDDDEVQPASSVIGDVVDAAKSAHVRKLLASVLLTNIVATLIDFLFKTYAFKHVDQANYGAFFSTTSFAFNLAALVVQLFFAGGLLRLVGAHRALQLLPLLFILTGVGTAFSSLIWLPLLYKGFDSAVRPSLMRTANELLLLPLPDNVRRGSKVMIDLFGQRIGQAIASLMILCAMSWAVREGHMVAGIVILSAVGVYVNVQLRPGYLDLFRAKLRDGFLGSDALPALDLDAVETLVLALNSPREGDVLAAIEILKEGGKLSLVPDLILMHPSPEVVLRVMPWLAIDRGRSLHPILERLVLPWAPPRVRAASLRMLVDQDHDCTLLQTYIMDPAVEVAATSLVGMIAMNRMKDENIAPALEKALHFEDADPNRTESNRARVALFDAMAWHPSKKFVPILDSAADDADPMVRRAVAHAIAKLGDITLLPALISMLGKADVRDDVRLSLTELGPMASHALGKALGDETLPFVVRRQIPGALAASGTPQATPLLLSRLQVEDDLGLRTRILRALRTISPSITAPAERAILDNLLSRSLKGATLSRNLLGQLEVGAEEDMNRDTPASNLLRSFIEERLQGAQENIFLALGLLDGREDYALVLRGLRGSNPALQASSRELLENVLKHDRSEILAILEPPTLIGPVDYEATLRTLLGAPSATARAIAAYHVRELNLGALQPDVMRLSVTADESVADLVSDLRQSMQRPIGGAA